MVDSVSLTSFKGSFYQGTFHLDSSKNSFENINPSNQEIICRCFESNPIPVMDALKTAIPKWRQIDLDRRIEMIRCYQQLMIKHADEGAYIIHLETGKSFLDAETEWNAMIKKIDWTIDKALQRVTSYRIENGECIFQPRGMILILGPFNFPGHLVNGQLVPALLTGNVVLMKPSEYTPLTGQLMIELMAQSGLEDVVGLVQGGAPLAQQILNSSDVMGVLFTGSYSVGMSIQQQSQKFPYRLVALEMGGINYSVVCADADIDGSVTSIIEAAWQMAGQKCSATRKVMVHQSIWNEVLSLLKFKIKNYSFQNIVPLSNSKSVEQYQLFVHQMHSLNANQLTPEFEIYEKGFYVKPCMFYFEDGCSFPIMKEENFSPIFQVEKFQTLDEVADQIYQTQYGLSASIFCKQRTDFERFRGLIMVGCVNWNRTTTGASSALPFGGLGKSGNHWPGGISMIDACVYPVSSLWQSNEEK